MAEKDFVVKNNLRVGKRIFADSDLTISGVLTGDGSGLTSLNADNIASGTIDSARIPSLSAEDITSGVLDSARIPASNAGDIPSLDASKINSGTFDSARIPSLNTADITSGTFSAARIGNNTVELGTKTTGAYVAALSEGFGINLANNTGETSTPTVSVDSPDVVSIFSGGTGVAINGSGQVSIGQAVATTDSVTFSNITATNEIGIFDSANGEEVAHFSGDPQNGLDIHAHAHSANGGIRFIIHDGGEDVHLQITRDSGVSFEDEVIHNVGHPVLDKDAANKSYVDGVAQGLTVKDAVRAATTANIIGTYDSGNNGVGAYIDVSALTVLDNVTLVSGDRILVKDQTVTYENGIYVYDSASRISRAVDADQDSEMRGGVFVFVEEGDVAADNGYVTTHTGPVVIGQEEIVWIQFSGAGQIIAGNGIAKSGNTLSVDLATGNTSGLEFSAGKLKINAGGAISVDGGNNELTIANNAITTDQISLGTTGTDVGITTIVASTSETTDVLPEGSTNLYYSAAKAESDARNALSADASGIVTYDDTTGVIGSLSIDSIFSQKLTSVDSSNVYIGYDIYDSVAGTFNVVIGYQGANETQDIDQSVVVGYQSGKYVTDINNSVLIGDRVNAPGDATRFYAGNNMSSLTDAVVIGTEAMGTDNDVIIGNQTNYYGRTSQNFETSSGNNVMVGHQAGYMSSYSSGTNTGNENHQNVVFIGSQAARQSSHVNTVAIGFNAALGTASAGTTQNNQDNVIIGTNAFAAIKAGQAGYNVAIGSNAMRYSGNSRDADENVFIGVQAGFQAGQSSNIARNTIIGNHAGQTLNGSYNASLGYWSLYKGSGDYNTSIGYSSGSGTQSSFGAILTGDDNIFLGYDARPVNTNTSNTLVIGSANTNNGIKRLEIPAMTNQASVGQVLTFQTDGTGDFIGFDSVTDPLVAIDSDYIELKRPAETIFTVGNSGSDYYHFTGDGFPTQANDNPDLFLTRGKTYRFKVTNGGVHPFAIGNADADANNNDAYTSGWNAIGQIGGTGPYIYDFTVPMDAPNKLRYYCTSHAAMVGNIYVDGNYDEGFFYDSAQREGGLVVGSPVFYNTATSKWTGADYDSTGDNVASHIVTDIQAGVGISVASSGIFDVSGHGLNLTPHSYYYLAGTAGGTVTSAPAADSGIFQPLYYALDSNTLDIFVGTPVDQTVITLADSEAQGVLSDARYKQNVNTLNMDATGTIQQLNPVSFEFISPDNKAMQGEQLGFIAQEIGEIIPQSVWTKDNEEQTMMLKPDAVIPVLVKAVQELKQELNEVKAKLEEMNG